MTMKKILILGERSICVYLCLALLVIGLMTSVPVNVEAKMIEKSAAAYQISQNVHITPNNISNSELENMRANERVRVRSTHLAGLVFL